MKLSLFNIFTKKDVWQDKAENTVYRATTTATCIWDALFDSKLATVELAKKSDDIIFFLTVASVHISSNELGLSLIRNKKRDNELRTCMLDTFIAWDKNAYGAFDNCTDYINKVMEAQSADAIHEIAYGTWVTQHILERKLSTQTELDIAAFLGGCLIKFMDVWH